MVVGTIKVIIFGAGGMLGSDLCKVFNDAISFTRNEVDITNRQLMAAVLRENMPDIVINAAAFTNVNRAEEESELAFEVNGYAPGYIAEECSQIGSKLIHYSTDYVFDGTKQEYIESDNTNPINVYGRSKLLGEQQIASKTDDFIIIRTSWLFGLNGGNFVKTMLELSEKMDTVKVVNDQFGKPTYTADLANKTLEIINLESGIYHITNEGICSWYEFASEVIDNSSPCSSEEFVTKAKRPRYSVLKNTKTSSMRPWRESVQDYLKNLKEQSK